MTAKTQTATVAKAASRKNVCGSCNLRSIGAGTGESNDRADARRLDLCVPCAEESQWEIVHSDNSHAELADGSLTWKGTTFKTKKSFDVWAAEEKAAMERCWYCHPELNRASAEYVVVAGTSREGMVIHARGSLAEKVAVIDDAAKTAGWTTKIVNSKKHETVTLTATSAIGAVLTVVWDARGRFQYGPTVARISADAKARKIRNVAEALRFIARPA